MLTINSKHLSIAFKIHSMAKRLKVSRKDLLKETDQFLSTSEKAMFFFMGNPAAVIGTVVFIIVAGSSFFGFRYYQEVQTLKNEALYFEMEKLIDSSNSFVSKAKSIWEKIGSGPQKERASLLLGDVYFQNQEYDKAEVLYSTVLNTSSSEQINYQLAQVGLAHSHESRKNYKKAIDLFKSVIEANMSFPLFGVYLSLSKCYELNNDVSSALLILREMQMKFSQSPQMDKIEDRIKQLSA